MKLIGTGAFSKVYREGESEHVYIRSNDPVKECMALGWFPRSRVFPKIEFSNIPEYNYKMRYFPRVPSLKSSLDTGEWEKYQALRALPYKTRCTYSLYKECKTIPYRGLRNAMLGAVEALGKYADDVRFEISPRNVAAWNGKLVLLDVFFIKSALDKARKGEL